MLSISLHLLPYAGSSTRDWATARCAACSAAPAPTSRWGSVCASKKDCRGPCCAAPCTSPLPQEMRCCHRASLLLPFCCSANPFQHVLCHRFVYAVCGGGQAAEAGRDWAAEGELPLGSALFGAAVAGCRCCSAAANCYCRAALWAAAEARRLSAIATLRSGQVWRRSSQADCGAAAARGGAGSRRRGCKPHSAGSAGEKSELVLGMLELLVMAAGGEYANLSHWECG